MVDSVGRVAMRDDRFGWWLPNLSGELTTGFVVAFGGCVAWPIVLLASVAELEEGRFSWE
jgi:hypothetical protein